jgi:hypothetical protein
MDTNTPPTNPPFPMMFVVLPTFVGALLWLFTLLSKVGP